MNLSFNARERNIGRQTLGVTYHPDGMRCGWCLGQSNFWLRGREQIGFFCPRSYSTRCRKPVCFWVYFVRHFDKFTCVVVFYSNEMQSTVSHVLFWFWHRCVSFSHLYFVSRILLVNALAIKPPIRLSRGNSVSWSMNVGTRSPDLTFSSLFQIHAHIRFGQHFHGS